MEGIVTVLLTDLDADVTMSLKVTLDVFVRMGNATIAQILMDMHIAKLVIMAAATAVAKA